MLLFVVKPQQGHPMWYGLLLPASSLMHAPGHGKHCMLITHIINKGMPTSLPVILFAWCI